MMILMNNHPMFDTQEFPFKFSRHEGALNPAFAFLCSTYMSNETIVQILKDGWGSGNGIDMSLGNFYKSTFGADYVVSRGYVYKHHLSNFVDLDRKRQPTSDETVILKMLVEGMGTLIRCLVNDLLFAVIHGEKSAGIDESKLSKLEKSYYNHSLSSVRVGKSIGEGIRYLATESDCVEFSKVGDGMNTTPEAKQLITGLLRIYVANIAFGNFSTGHVVSFTEKKQDPADMLSAANVVLESILAIMGTNSRDDDEDQFIGYLVAKKLVSIITGIQVEVLDNFMKRLCVLSASKEKTRMGIVQQKIESNTGHRSDRQRQGKNLKNATSRDKGMFASKSYQGRVLRKMANNNMEQIVRTETVKTGHGDVYILVDVSGSTTNQSSDSGVPRCILFEAIAIATVDACRATKTRCTVYFYGTEVYSQTVFETSDSKITFNRKKQCLVNQAGMNGNNEMLAIEHAFNDIRDFQNSLPANSPSKGKATILMLTDGQVLTDYGSKNMGMSVPDAFRMELNSMQGIAKVEILPILIGKLERNFVRAFAGRYFVHLYKDEDLSTTTITDIMMFIAGDPNTQEHLDVVPFKV